MSAQLIQTYYDSFNKMDFNKMLSLLSADVVHEVNEGEPQIGVETFKKFMGVMDAHYSEQVKDLVVFTSSNPQRFAAEFFIDGVYKKTQEGLPPANNQKYYIKVGAFFEVKDNKITRVTNHYNLANWINVVTK